ncbi:hypothetical protein F5Y09DRAFT_338176 [Xylaria sp. FL1042]|nr:hypothetical protein F5Y09DRAFT_338176 [Xylaria sp. FL1042]
MSTDEETPFLTVTGEETTTESPKNHGHYSQLFQNSKVHKIVSIFQLVLLAFNIGLLVILLRAAQAQGHRDYDDIELQGSFGSAKDTIEYVTSEFDTGPSPFTGKPRHELDQAWSDLLRSTSIKVSEAELKSMNKSSVALADGSGYIGYLEVHHLLHCVKRLYQSQFPEYYHDVEEYAGLSTWHRESLIQGLTCNADMTFNTYAWKSPHELRGIRSGSRRCTNWSRIQAWADERDFKGTPWEMLATLVPMDTEDSRNNNSVI